MTGTFPATHEKNAAKGWGHLTKERARMVGNLTKKNKKCQMPEGQPRAGAWAPLELTHI